MANTETTMKRTNPKDMVSFSFYDSDDDEKTGFLNWVSEAYPFIFFTFVHIVALIWVLS